MASLRDIATEFYNVKYNWDSWFIGRPSDQEVAQVVAKKFGGDVTPEKVMRVKASWVVPKGVGNIAYKMAGKGEKEEKHHEETCAKCGGVRMTGEGKKKPKVKRMLGEGMRARNEAVKELMRTRGVSMIEASKMLKGKKF